MPKTPFPWTRRDTFAVLAIFVLALALRWAWPGIIDFKLDEASNSRIALAWGQDGVFPLTGVTSSTGIPTPPFAAWLLAPPYFIAPDPLLATAWVGFLSALSVAAGYWLAQRYFGTYAGLIAGLLHAAAPFAVYQARKVWTPGLQPLFAVLTVTAGMLGFIEKRERWQAVHVFLLAFTVGVHFSSLPLVLVSAFLLWAGRRAISWRWLAIGAAAVLVVAAPFVAGVLGNPDVVMIADTAAKNHQIVINADALIFTLMNITGHDLYKWAVPDASPDHPINVQDEVGPLLTLLLVIFVAQAASLALYNRRTSGPRDLRIPAASTILVWAFAYVTVFTVQWVPVHPHYFIALWPAPHLVIAAGLSVEIDILRKRAMGWRMPAILGFGLAAAIAGGQIYMQQRFFDYVGSHFTPGDFGTPLGMKMQGARAAIDLLETTDAREILVLGEGDRPYQYEGPGTFDVMLHNISHRFINDAYSVVLPDHPAVVLVQPGVDWPIVPWYAAIAQARAPVPLREDEGEYQLYSYNPTGREALLTDFEPAREPNLLENGARILGYRWDIDQHIDIAWRVEAPPPFTATDTLENYHFGVYVFDPEAGISLAQTDGPAHWVPYWRPGDIVITRLPAIEHAAGEQSLELRAAMYLYPAIMRAQLAGGAGDSVLLKVW